MNSHDNYDENKVHTNNVVEIRLSDYITLRLGDYKIIHMSYGDINRYAKVAIIGFRCYTSRDGSETHYGITFGFVSSVGNYPLNTDETKNSWVECTLNTDILNNKSSDFWKSLPSGITNNVVLANVEDYSALSEYKYYFYPYRDQDIKQRTLPYFIEIGYNWREILSNQVNVNGNIISEYVPMWDRSFGSDYGQLIATGNNLKRAKANELNPVMPMFNFGKENKCVINEKY